MTQGRQKTSNEKKGKEKSSKVLCILPSLYSPLYSDLPSNEKKKRKKKRKIVTWQSQGHYIGTYSTSLRISRISRGRRQAKNPPKKKRRKNPQKSSSPLAAARGSKKKPSNRILKSPLYRKFLYILTSYSSFARAMTVHTHTYTYTYTHTHNIS
jgi:hypothetical protein